MHADEFSNDIQTVFDALKELKNMDKEKIKIKIDDKYQIINKIASGGFKTIYDLGDGSVIAVRNFGVDVVTLDMANNWVKAISIEKEEADKLKALGLETQDYEIISVQIGDDYLPVIKMPNFTQMAKEAKLCIVSLIFNS